MPEMQTTPKALQGAIEAMTLDGQTVETIGHSLISEGLNLLAGSLCSGHLLEQLTFLRKVIDERIELTKREIN